MFGEEDSKIGTLSPPDADGDLRDGGILVLKPQLRLQLKTENYAAARYPLNAVSC
jgi:hypothetical protein